jgi:hypothetical protein
MACDEIINLMTAIGTLMAVIVALIIAIFQDWLRALYSRPNLEISIDLCPPDCHKTRLHLLSVLDMEGVPTTTTLYPHTEVAADIATFTSGPAPSRIADAYYFRLKVRNLGRRRAESVEVFAAKLERKQADGTFSKVDSFLPMNLLWSYHRQVFLPAISPKTYKHCDLAHIIDPSERENFPGEHKTWPNVSSEKTVLSFDTASKPYVQSYLVPAGIYLLNIVIAAANAEPVEETLEITLTGDWYDNEQEMLSQGIGIRIP